MLKDGLCGGTVALQCHVTDHGHIVAGRDISELAGAYHGKRPVRTAHLFGYPDLGLSPIILKLMVINSILFLGLYIENKFEYHDTPTYNPCSYLHAGPLQRMVVYPIYSCFLSLDCKRCTSLLYSIL